MDTGDSSLGQDTLTLLSRGRQDVEIEQKYQRKGNVSSKTIVEVIDAAWYDAETSKL